MDLCLHGLMNGSHKHKKGVVHDHAFFYNTIYLCYAAMCFALASRAALASSAE